MAKLVAGRKCIVHEQLLEPLAVSFQPKNIAWKKEYSKYPNQHDLVLPQFGNDNVMLKTKNGKVIKFPLDCIKRSEANSDNLEKEYEKDSQLKRTLTRDTQFHDMSWKDELAFSKSTRGMVKYESPEILVIEENKNQSTCSNDGGPLKKKFHELYGVLQALNLLEYYRNLVSEGFESLEYLKFAEFQDLMALGMKRGHARRLLRAMEDYRANPSYNFKIRNLQKRASVCSSQTSSSSSCSTGKSSSISLLSLAEHESYALNHFENLSPGDDLPINSNESFGFYSKLDANRIQRRSGPAYLSCESPSNVKREYGGYLILTFRKGSLGFGFMSPFLVGTLVTSITDKRLKMMGLKIGLPLVQINHINITRCSAEEVASLLASVELPCTITFGLVPWFAAGQNGIDMSNKKWYPCVHEGMSHSLEEDTIMHYSSPFEYKSAEWISDWNRRKPLSTNVWDTLQQSLLQKQRRVPFQRLSHEVGRNGNNLFQRRGDNVQKELAILNCGFVDKQRSYNDSDNTQTSDGKRGSPPIHRYMGKDTGKKMTTILQANLKGYITASIGFL